MFDFRKILLSGAALAVTTPLDFNAIAENILPLNLDLPAAIRMANEQSPVILEARERINEQAGVLTVSKSSRLPDINAVGLYQWEEESRSGSFGGPNPPDEDYWRAGVELTQPLYAGGILSAAVRTRTYQSLALDAQVIATRNDVFTDVFRKFYYAMLTREVIRVQEESVSLLERQLSLARNRFEAGAVSRFDVLQAEVRLANARPPLIRAHNQYNLAVDDLRTTIGGVYPEGMGPTNVTLSGDWTVLTMPDSLTDALESATRNRPELTALAMNSEASRAWVERMKRQRAPRINLFANYGIENDRFSPGNERLEGWQAGVEARLNIWDGGRIRGEVAQAQSQLDQVLLQQHARHLSIELEVRNAWNQAEEAREILTASELIIDQAEEALRLAENRYNAGTLTQLDVLASQLDYTRAKLEHLTALHDYHVALVEMYRAVGETPGIQFVETISH
ncbi:MAG TPA: TolC family protein [Kiritimatiellia bacterium]|nr:TolC family protein [Kiritimatiellia bacterium]